MFLSMMIALALHQLLQSPAQRPGDGWLLSWHHWVASRVAAPELAAALTVAVPLLLVAWLLSVAEESLFGLVSLLLCAALLLWSLGREDYHTAMERYLAQREGGNDEGAWLGVQMLWSPDPDPGPGDVDPQAAAAQGEQRLLYCGYQRWFAPLLYFLLLGPLGAVAYRALQLLVRGTGEAAYADVLRWLDWPASRLLALSFSVTGDFVAVLRAQSLQSAALAPGVLYRAARAAVTAAAGPREFRDLLYRTAGLWLLLAGAWFIFM